MTKKELEETNKLNKENKLKTLYNECLEELNTIGIDFSNNGYGVVDIGLAKRKTKRYGCCKNEDPDKTSSYRKNRRTYYRVFKTHHIEISDWLMDLNDDIIKNTIVHELIHCLPDCNNHGDEFKRYARYINDTLGYNITRVGNKKEDYDKSNIEYADDSVYTEDNSKYRVRCTNCGYSFFRRRLQRGFARNYRCGKCMGKFEVIEL